jgi:hypothetical protein
MIKPMSTFDDMAVVCTLMAASFVENVDHQAQ